MQQFRINCTIELNNITSNKYIQATLVANNKENLIDWKPIWQLHQLPHCLDMARYLDDSYGSRIFLRRTVHREKKKPNRN